MQLQDKYLKGQECSILLQGVNWPALITFASVPLPPVQARPTAAPPLPGPHHLYHLPQSRVGQSVVNRKLAIPAQHPHTPQFVHPICQLRGSCCLSRQPSYLDFPQPLCLLCPTPALPLALLCFWPYNSLQLNRLIMLAPI